MGDSTIDNQTTQKEPNNDVVQGFIEENTLDEQLVSQYKRYKRYGDCADRWLPRLFVVVFIGAILATIVDMYVYMPNSTTISEEIEAIFSLVVIVPMLILGISALLRWNSDVSSEEVAYHELASAFEQYRQDPNNIDPVLDRLSNSLLYFESTHRFERIDSKSSQDIKRYLEKIDDTDGKSYIKEVFHDTFPTFMQELAISVAPDSDTRFSSLAKTMDAAYTGESSLKEGLYTDLKRLSTFLFTGTELFVISLLILLSGLVLSSILDFSTAVGIGGIMIALYTVYQDRE